MTKKEVKDRPARILNVVFCGCVLLSASFKLYFFILKACVLEIYL